MTVTAKKRKFNAKADENDVQATVDEFGQKYHCDHCSKDITQQVRIRCAECTDFDLCVECFASGVEMKDHLRTHSYRVIEMLDFPIFSGDWGADEELLLVEGLEIFGIGNWEQISEHIGTKNKLECENHYNAVFVSSSNWPFPEIEFSYLNSDGTRRRARSPTRGSKKLPKVGRPPASGPTNHEIQGFMPGRGDFEHEYENDAEQIVKDMEFFEDEDDHEIDLKCAILNIYNTTLDRRNERKSFIFDRHFTDFKKIQNIEKRRPREEKELYQKMRVFAKLQTSSDFEDFMEGLLVENKLKREIAALQEYRQMGITTLEEANIYEKEKLLRFADRPGDSFSYARKRKTRGDETVSNDYLAPSGHHHVSSAGSHSPSGGRKPANPLDISQTDGVELLSEAEQQLCSNLRLFPRAYLAIKDTLLKEYASKGSLKRRQARQLVKIDVNKTSRVYDFFLEMGWVS